MEWITTTALFLSAFKAALCFNIDPVSWKSLSNNAAGFGYQVVQRPSDLLVSAPLEQLSASERGEIYKCSIESCSPLQVNMPNEVKPYAVNMSLGLTMTSDPSTQNTMACGPTIPKDCQSITMYNGLCFQIDGSNVLQPSPPFGAEECRVQADIAFLLDGSGSVQTTDFQTMKDFVKTLISSFREKDTKFAIAQFSNNPTVHYYFDTFEASNWKAQIDGIRQLKGGTYTAEAITHVVQNVFTTNRGSRPGIKKVLIVITDGVSHDRAYLSNAASLAEQKQIVRFSIGVGGAFNDNNAKLELETIASSPPKNHVFQVEDYDALQKIKESLQEKIFSIEGSQTGGELLTMEMAQMGFSAAYSPEGYLMAIVGANQWRGGYVQYKGREQSPYEPTYVDTDSYLGYSMAVAKTTQGSLSIVGAPRYQHRGMVMTVETNGKNKTIDPFPCQTGEYFGAAVCAMDVDRNGYTDLILISAPMYRDTDREGRVYVCSITGLDVECNLQSPLVLRGVESDQGRFGSSLAVLPDLNTDGFSDLAVGAPLEDDGQGSIYIFHGEGAGRINLAYSQRIAASQVQSGLKFFGMSISQSSHDLSQDGLPDLAVGSKGTVVLLRSKPIVMVEATVSFTPHQIPQNSNCSKPLENTASICFSMTRLSTVDTARARINFTFTLDATRKVPNNRAYISEKQQAETRSFELDLQQQNCTFVKFFVEACPEDALNELSNELRFTFEGLLAHTNLSPSLALQAKTKSIHPLTFEINCGPDRKCVDSLKVDFNFTSSLEVKVGIDELLNVTVLVENSEENSYNSLVILTYPAGLSYRKLTTLEGRIECKSLDSEGGITRGKSDCTIDKPIFKSNTKALFIISYGIDTTSQFDRKIFITANATSGNQEHSSLSQPYKIKDTDVKYSIFVSVESSLSYNNFTFGNSNEQKPFQQPFEVINDIRPLNFTVVIRVPVKLGDKDIWVDSNSLQFPGCQREKDSQPNVTDFVNQIRKNKLVDCSVAWCGVFKCNRFMGTLDSEKYIISANMSSRWIQQIGLESVKFLLTSTVSLEYDTNQYIYFSAASNYKPPVRKLEAVVEVYPEPDFTKEIVGGCLGGLAFLVLLTAGLYKAGFFKSKYKEMINNDGEGGAENPGFDGGEQAPE